MIYVFRIDGREVSDDDLERFRDANPDLPREDMQWISPVQGDRHRGVGGGG